MSLSITHLALLIEMTEVEIYEMKKVIESNKSTDEEKDDAGEHTVQLLSLSSALQEIYSSQITNSDSAESYDELIDDIHERRF